MAKQLSRILLLVSLLFFSLSPIAFAQQETLKVGVALGDPFVILNNNNFSGIAIDIWKLLAEEQKLKYQFISMGEHIDSAVAALAAGEIDVLIGPIVPTYERVKLVDFMRPYYMNQIGLVVPIKQVGFFQAIGSIFNTAISSALIIFLVFFLLYLHVFWYYEKESNPRVSSSYWEGIRETFWLHTLDIDLGELPKHIRTRQFRFLWLIFVTLFFSSITAAITSALTIALSDQYVTYDNINDFRNKKIAAVVSTAPYTIAKGMGLNIVSVGSREEAIAHLLKNNVGAYVDYYPIAEYYLNKHQLTNKLTMANAILKRDTFAFALPLNSPLRHSLDVILSSLQEYGLIKSVCEKYFADNGKVLLNCEI